jgi:hypothetical protein
MYIPVLEEWASVSRTFDAAEKIISNCKYEDDEQKNWTLHELETLHKPLDMLAQIARQELWRKEKYNNTDIQTYLQNVIDNL